MPLRVTRSVTELPGKKKVNNSRNNIPHHCWTKQFGKEWEKIRAANLFAKERTYLRPGKIVVFERLAEKLATVSSTIRNVLKARPPFAGVLPPGVCHGFREELSEILQRPCAPCGIWWAPDSIARLLGVLKP